jgi:hypothetical protein
MWGKTNPRDLDKTRGSDRAAFGSKGGNHDVKINRMFKGYRYFNHLFFTKP